MSVKPALNAGKNFSSVHVVAPVKVKHEQVERWMVDMVSRRLHDFDYLGQLDRQHYSFCRTGAVNPFPVYQHLLFCYNRTARRLQVKVGCSLLLEWQLRRSKGRISHISPMLACDLSGHRRFVESRDLFEEQLQSLLDSFLLEHTRQLAEDEILREAMAIMLQGGKLREPRFDSKLISDLRLVKKQRNAPPKDDSSQVEVTQKRSRELDNFLADLTPVESKVSSGSFTLNAEKAGLKLQKFQLASPQNFVVHLVGGAVAGGASEVGIYVDSDDIVVEFDGLTMSREDLAALPQALLSPEASPQLRELAVALNAALSLQPQLLKVESWTGKEGFTLDVTADGTLSKLERSPFADQTRVGHRIHFKDRPSLRVAQRLINSLKQNHPEIDLLKERCSYSPIPIVWEGQDLRQFPVEEAVLALKWESEDNPIDFPDLSSIPGQTETSLGESGLLFLVGPNPGFFLSVNGVCYEAPGDLPDLACWCLISNKELSRDLSFTGITRNTTWNQTLTVLLQAQNRIRQVALEALPSSLGKQKEKLSLYLRREAFRGFEEALGQPIFRSLDDRYVSASQLTSLPQISYTAQAWEHPLRSGESVYCLEAEDRSLIRDLGKQFKRKPSFRVRDEELKISQVYFSKRERWLALEPEAELRLSSCFGPKRELKERLGEMGLQKRLNKARLELYCQGRPLPPANIERLPEGLQIVLNDDALDVDDSWSQVLDSPSLQSLKKVLNLEITEFYKSLFQHGAQFNLHLLAYLVYRKKQGQDWQSLLNRLHFPLLGNETISWGQLNNRDGIPGLRARWAKTFHLSLKQKQLLAQLI